MGERVAESGSTSNTVRWRVGGEQSEAESQRDRSTIETGSRKGHSMTACHAMPPFCCRRHALRGVL